MSTITLSASEYKELKQRADAFGRLVSTQERLSHLTPAIRSRARIISAMKETNRYSLRFLKSLEKGMKRSASFSD